MRSVSALQRTMLRCPIASNSGAARIRLSPGVQRSRRMGTTATSAPAVADTPAADSKPEVRCVVRRVDSTVEHPQPAPACRRERHLAAKRPTWLQRTLYCSRRHSINAAIV
jgi:hypothetical protein